MNDVDVSKSYDEVREGVQAFIDMVQGDEKKFGFSAKKFVTLYDIVFRVATQRQGAQNYAQTLYEELYVGIISDYLSTKSASKLKKACAQPSTRDKFLKEWQKEYIKTTNIIKGVRSAFMYLDRYYTGSQEGVLPLKAQAYKIFEDKIFNKFKEKTRGMLLSAIRDEREGKEQNRIMLKSSIRPFVELGETLGNKTDKLRYYKRYLEADIVKDAGNFYKGCATTWRENDSLSGYLIKVEQAFDKERSRVEEYLVKETKTPLLRRCYEELLKEHQQELLEKVTGLNHMLKQERKTDLSRLYEVYSLYLDDLPMIADMFKDQVAGEGDEIVQRAAAETKGGDENLVKDLIALHKRYNDIVKLCFKSSQVFQRALKSAFESFVNEGDSVSRLLARYSHGVLSKSSKSSKGSDETLDQIVFLYGYIRDKDVFDHEYQLLLQDRLLRKKCSSEHLEKTMISKLKAEAGYQWAKQLEGMFEDVALSKTLTKEFKNSRNPSENKGFELNITVCKHGQWPSSSYTSSKIPPELKDVADNFRKFYISRYREREIQWRMDMGEAEVQVKFNPRTTVRLAVSTYQMCILLCFNRKKIISYAEILDVTGLNDDVTLQNHLLSLAHPKLKVLLKRPNDRSIDKETKFMINGKFTCPLRKITVKLLTIIKEQQSAEVDEGVKIQRRCQMDACIVRTMKQRKTMKHIDLVREVTAQLQARFKPSPAMIKKRIEHLIEQEYMKRDPNRRGVYEYLA